MVLLVILGRIQARPEFFNFIGGFFIKWLVYFLNKCKRWQNQPMFSICADQAVNKYFSLMIEIKHSFWDLIDKCHLAHFFQ